MVNFLNTASSILIKEKTLEFDFALHEKLQIQKKIQIGSNH
jgi:hypothetical protein